MRSVQAALKMQKKASDYAVGIVKLFETFVEVVDLVKVRSATFSSNQLYHEYGWSCPID
jgi:hypothetical protein